MTSTSARRGTRTRSVGGGAGAAAPAAAAARGGSPMSNHTLRCSPIRRAGRPQVVKLLTSGSSGGTGARNCAGGKNDGGKRVGEAASQAHSLR